MTIKRVERMTTVTDPHRKMTEGCDVTRAMLAATTATGHRLKSIVTISTIASDTNTSNRETTDRQTVCSVALTPQHDSEADATRAEIGKTNIVSVTGTSSTQSELQPTTPGTAPTTPFTSGAGSNTEEYSSSTGLAEQQEVPATIATDSATFEALKNDAPISGRMVVLQWSNVRGTPDINGDLLTTLVAGETVTKISQNGQWVEIQIDERPSVTGYMHHSTVAVYPMLTQLKFHN